MMAPMTDGKDLKARLSDASRGAIAASLGDAAGRTARAMMTAAAPETGAQVAYGNGAAHVTLTGPGLFAREFGALDSTADPVIAPALTKLKRRPA